MKPVIVLIHSPLVGPFTWAPVAKVLREQGSAVVVPTLVSPAVTDKAYWRLHSEAVAQVLGEIPAQQPVLLVAHSGAGPLLPAIRQAIPHPLAGYLFADAGWPVNGKSRLDLFEDAEAVAQFRQSAVDGLLPAWTDADLQPVIPDDSVRQQFVSELRPLPLAVYEEALPVFPGWPDAPCAYLRFGENPAYDTAFTQARQRGCAWMKLGGAHFHMLVNPQEVADALRTLSAQMGLDL